MTDPADRMARARGALIGMALGDALGAPVEFESAHQIAGRRDELFALPGGGSFDWAPGEFTDDTQMAIVLARHLAACAGAIEQAALAREFAQWALDAADVGIQTCEVLSAIDRGESWQQAIAGLSPEAAGNGSLMRVAPAALPAASRDGAVALARAQSEVTHPNGDCMDACAVFTSALWDEIEGERVPLDVLAERASEPGVREAIERAAAAEPPPMSGWVLYTLTGALWAVYGAAGFNEAIWRAVALGRDADTVGAVAGALAGARWGVDGIERDLARQLQSQHPMFVGDYPADIETIADTLVALRDGQ